MYSEVNIFLILSKNILFNSLAPIWTFLLFKKLFFKTLNFSLILNNSETRLLTCLSLIPISFANSLKVSNCLGLYPLNTIFPFWIESSPATNNSSNLPIVLLKAGLPVDIPDSFAITPKDWSISNNISLATNLTPDTNPSACFLPSNNVVDSTPLALNGVAIHLSIHLLNALLLNAISFPFLAISCIIPAPYANGKVTKKFSPPNLNLLYNLLAASSPDSDFSNLSISNGLLISNLCLRKSPNVPISSELATNAAPAPKPAPPIAIEINLSLPLILLSCSAFSAALPKLTDGFINLFALAAATASSAILAILNLFTGSEIIACPILPAPYIWEIPSVIIPTASV